MLLSKKLPGTRPGKLNREALRLGDVGSEDPIRASRPNSTYQILEKSLYSMGTHFRSLLGPWPKTHSKRPTAPHMRPTGGFVCLPF